jgi:Zinc binding domain
MKCCATDAAAEGCETTEAVVNQDERCRKCDGQSRPVSLKTVLLMLNPHLLEEALSGTYSFCQAPDCPIVYFEENGSRVFTSDDLRAIVGAKASSDPIPLCYCFGFDEGHLCEEIARSGNTTIPDRISSLIREGLCACEARNPSGVCCLGEVNRTAKRLRQELSVK